MSEHPPTDPGAEADPELGTIVVYGDLDFLIGVWSDEEAEQFEASLREQRRIDSGDWR